MSVGGENWWDEMTNWYALYWLQAIITWIIFFVIWFGIGAVCAYYVYRDAKKTRGMPALIWSIIAFLTTFIGVLIYLLMKNAKH